MDGSIGVYDNSYSRFSDHVYEEIRGETYGVDLGQTGWMTANEYRGFLDLLSLTSASRVLEIGCGAGGCALYLARTVGAEVIGIDINENGIRNARTLADSAGAESRLHFERVDASEGLPFPTESFDAVFSNDAVCHIANRLQLLKECRRVLKPGGRVLFTDALVITGAVSNEEIAMRSSIGYYVFVPGGENERLIAAAGLDLLSITDLTTSAAEISERWRDARARRRESLVQIECEPNFLVLQEFLACVHSLADERRLSRFMYLCWRPDTASADPAFLIGSASV